MAKKNIEEEYKLLTQEEQILLRPDTQLGSIVPEAQTVWAARTTDLSTVNFKKQELTYIPAFIKLYDEILTNASDHAQRGGGVKNIKINIDSNFTISIWNDGDGIPVVKHKETKLWLPDMLLGNLNSGSNYNDNDERYGAGRNGVGSSLVSLFSKEFTINCADGKKMYHQVYENNRSIKHEPTVKTSRKKFTHVTYTTDFDRLPIAGLEEDTLKICIKRAYDIAVYNPKVKVYFNDTLIKVNNAKDWCNLHLEEDSELFIENINDKWDVGLAQSFTDGFEQCSIVNGNTTWEGGTHVNSLMNKVIKRLTTDITKGHKNVKIRPIDIKNKFHLFIVCKIANPIFDSQTKENLKMRLPDDVDLSDKLYKAIMKSDIMESILEWVQMKAQAALNKMNKKSAGKSVRIPKLVDAHKAGTTQAQKCSLLLCEGDSAVQTAIAGISAVSRDYYGAFPLKGKVLNVRDVKISRIIENDEIKKLLQIIGLVPGHKYKSLTELRYGKIILMTDADVDGISIKGLLINFIHKFWPELLELGLIFEFITPIVIATKGKVVKEYYDLNKYKQDKGNNKLDNYNIKYYKGLGTIKSNQIKEMFKNLNKHLIQFKYDHKRDNDKIDMLFNKKRVNDRREWLLKYKGEIVPVKTSGINEMNEFFDNEFIQFSNEDNIRSIPNMIDGLKPSQRKILYAGLKKLGNTEKNGIKVAQFAAYTAENSAYHHGEDSLNKAIVSMSQDFVGGNNLPLLIPDGQFGTRRDPKASASPRYIFTYKNNITDLIFRKEDEGILNYLDDDGQKIEPKFYLPIIPTLLMNGTTGIGTGWSTDIWCYDVMSLIAVIKRKISKPNTKYAINPSYNNWSGELNWLAEKNTYETSGVLTLNKAKTRALITELPINVWTDKYLDTLDKLVEQKKIKKFIDNSTDTDVSIEIHLNGKVVNENTLYTTLKLKSNLSLNNMHAFLDNKIVKWETAESLLDDWFDIRKEYYAKRKENRIEILNKNYDKLKYTFAFIKAVIAGTVVLNNRSKLEITTDLENMEFMKIDDSYDYLLNMPLYNLTQEKYEYYKNLSKQLKEELTLYKETDPTKIWKSELLELEKMLKKSGY